MAVTSQNLVFLAYHGDQTRIHLTSSNDWSARKGLSLEDTFNADPVNLAVDEFDVAHAFWTEQRDGLTRAPFYTNSATGWDLVQIPVTVEGCWKGSSFAARGRFEIFLPCSNQITRWTITNGTQFAKTAVPDSADTDSASAVRDGVGNVYVASTRGGLYTVLQGSGDGFMAHRAGLGRSPTVAVTQRGELHVLRWGMEQSDAELRMPFLYSNSLRGFQTWTALPFLSASFFNNLMPLNVDVTRGRLYAAIKAVGSVQICSAAHTGLASNTGTSWTCAPVGGERGEKPASALAPDGTLNLAWVDGFGLGYANSLGSFLAKNFTPQITFGTPSSTTSAAIVPASISDPDGDSVAGDVQVGNIQDVVSLVEPGTTERIFLDQYAISNVDDRLVDGASEIFTWLEFRVPSVSNWFSTVVERNQISTFPVTVEVNRTGRYVSSTPIGTFQILAWDETGATISETQFVASVTVSYSSALPREIDISSLPVGNVTIGISASDGSTSTFGSKPFTKTAGQTKLLLTQP